jgi:hypothetical protein
VELEYSGAPNLQINGLQIEGVDLRRRITTI